MSLVLKSNNTAINFITDKYGIFSKYQWSLLTDFNKEEYYSNGSKASLNDVLTVRRNVSALVLDANGEYTTVQKNEPRISYNPSLTTKGLLMESKGLRYAYDNPQSQVVSVGKIEETDIIVLEVVGTGSVDVSASNITAKTAPATQDSKMYIKATGKEVFDVNLTVRGDVTKAVFSSQGMYPVDNTSVISTTQGRSSDEQLKFDALNDIDGLEYTYLVSYQPNEYLKDIARQLDVYGSGEYVELAILSINTKDRWLTLASTASDSKALEFGFRTYKDGTADELIMHYVVKDSPARTVTLVDFDINEPLILAVSCSQNGFRVAHNGQCTELLTAIPPILLNELNLGLTRRFGAAWKPSGVFSKIAVFDRAMNRHELEQLTLKSI